MPHLQPRVAPICYAQFHLQIHHDLSKNTDMKILEQLSLLIVAHCRGCSCWNNGNFKSEMNELFLQSTSSRLTNLLRAQFFHESSFYENRLELET